MSTPWDPAYTRKSKTYTSSRVKDRWNARHYDDVHFRTGTGGREAIALIAKYKGLSVAEYLRHLIIADVEAMEMPEKPDISAILGGGGR